ncbi:MAG: hypothetical protein U0R80_00400 [Nocardioidaceae bacterium]
MNVEAYGCYTIQSSLADPGGDCFIHVPNAGLDPGRVIAMWGYDSRGVDFTDHFEFVAIPAPVVDNVFFLVNRRSGLPLRVRGDHVIQGVAVDSTEAERSEQGAQWVLEPVDDEFRIMSLLTGFYLSPRDFRTVDGTGLSLVAPVLRAGLDDRVRHFRLGRVASLMGRLPEPVTAKGARFAKLKSIDTELPDRTPALLREVEVLPFFVVVDPSYPPSRQVQVSPYYTLRLSKLWSKVFDRQLDGIVERETEETTETGLTTVDAQSVMSTFSWSVSAEASAGYKGYGVSASMKLTSQLAGETKRTSESSSEHREQHQLVESIVYPAIGQPYRLVSWRPVDRYELCRKDGSLVQSWDVVRTEQEVIDVFPRSVTIPPTVPSQRDPGRSARRLARKEAVAVPVA